MEKVDLPGELIVEYLFDQNPTPMLIFDRETLEILDINEAAIDKYGYAREEFTAMTIKQIRPEEDIPILLQNLDNGNSQRDTSIYRHRTKSGEMIFMQVSAKEFTYNDRILRLAVLHDITEEIEAKIRSQQAESLARLGWWTYEVKRNQVIWSDKLYEIMNADKDSFEATFEAFFNLLYPEDRLKLDNIMNKVQQTNQPLDYTLRVLDKNKKLIYLKCRAQGIFNADDELIRINGVSQDVTEQMEIQIELEKRSQAIASSMDGISMANEEGEFIYMNESHANIYGYESPDELIGKTWHVLYRDEDKTYFSNQVMPKIEQEGAWRGEATGKRKDGTTFPQEVSLSITSDGGLICVVRDITQRKKHEQETKQSLKEKETLLEEIHHRVKNNLNVITSILELKKLEPADSIEALIDDTQSRIKSIATIHEKLYQSETLSDVDLREYIEDFCEVILDSLNPDEKNITITKDLQRYKLDTTRAVPIGLIVNELVNNAFKHGFSGTDKLNILISLEVENDKVILSVANDGTPLPKDFSVQNSDSMGMTLVKTLTEQIGGKLDITQNEWTTFRIEFPVIHSKES